MRKPTLVERHVLALSLTAVATVALQGPPAEAACLGVGNVCVPCSGNNVCSQGGGVLSTPHVYLIYWGWNSGNDPNRLIGIPSTLISYLSGTPYMNILSQYGVTNPTASSLLAGTYIETSALPSDTAASNSTWDSRIARVAKNYAISSGHSSDPNAVYVVMTPTRTNHPSGYCARHDSIANSGYHAVVYVDLPYQTDFGQSCYGGLAQPSDAESVVLWHELAEAFTDPRSNTEGKAYVDSGDEEIGDKCTTTSSSPPRYATLRGFNYQAIPPIWSNASNFGSGACVTTYRTEKGIVERGSDNTDYLDIGPSWLAWPLGQTLNANSAGIRWDTSTNTIPAVRSDVFATGVNGDLLHGFKGGSTSGSEDMGPPPAGYVFTGRPAVVSPTPGTLVLYARGLSAAGSALFTHTYNAAPSIQIGPFWTQVPLPSGAAPLCAPPGAVNWSWGNVSRTDIFYLGCEADAHLHHLYQGSNGWFADDWGVSQAAGRGSLAGTPSVASWGDGRLDVFIADYQGQLQHAWFDNGYAGWDNWGKPPGTSFQIDPSVTDMGDGRLSVVGAGMDGNVWEATWGIAGGGGWNSIGHSSSANAVGAVNFAF